jgi:hypothetical protein
MSEVPPVLKDLNEYFGEFSDEMLSSIVVDRHKPTADKLREGLRRANVLK